MEAASGQDQASVRFDGVAAQVDAAGVADRVAYLKFDAVAAVAESATASDNTASYIGVVNLAGESFNAAAVQDATSVGLCAVTETASAAVMVDNRRILCLYLLPMADFNGNRLPLPSRLDAPSRLAPYRHAILESMFGRTCDGIPVADTAV